MIQKAAASKEQILKVGLVILRNHPAVLKDNVAGLTAESMGKFNRLESERLRRAGSQRISDWQASVSFEKDDLSASFTVFSSVFIRWPLGSECLLRPSQLLLDVNFFRPNHFAPRKLLLLKPFRLVPYFCGSESGLLMGPVIMLTYAAKF
jgi:hypothetical protein